MGGEIPKPVQSLRSDWLEYTKRLVSLTEDLHSTYYTFRDHGANPMRDRYCQFLLLLIDLPRARHFSRRQYGIGAAKESFLPPRSRLQEAVEEIVAG